jgi:dGTPase
VLVVTRARLAAARPGSVDDVRAAGRPLVGFSGEMAAEERALKRFMYAKLYHHPVQLEVSGQAGRIIAGLAAAYRADPMLLPPAWRERLPEGEPARTRHMGDFIAGMTDRYAIARYREVVGAVEISEGF